MTPVGRGDVVHLEGRADAGSWLVDQEQGLLVLLPDSLVSGTSISSSIRCMRRAVLGEMFKVRSYFTLEAKSLKVTAQFRFSHSNPPY